MVSASPLTQSSAHVGLAAEVPVAKGSTTSRVVLSNELIRVVHFTFDAGEQLTDHTSPRAVVCQCNDGRIDFTVDGQTSTLGPGDIVYLAPGARHALVATQPARLTLTMVDVERLDE